jgi:hypothetical protein
MLTKLLLVLLLAMGSIPAFAVEGPEGPYLFDLMKQPAYRAAWSGMLAGETVPAWVEGYAKTLDGPATPSLDISVGDEAYTLAFTCKAHDCGDNQLYVLFSRGGAKGLGSAAHWHATKMARGPR